MKPMNVKELVERMTLEEKIEMCSGVDFWHLKGIERLGIPSIMVSDGPHGLRKQRIRPITLASTIRFRRCVSQRLPARRVLLTERSCAALAKRSGRNARRSMWRFCWARL